MEGARPTAARPGTQEVPGLADDTEVTVEIVDKKGLPDADTIASDVYDFGPDGTTFEKPVRLTIDFASAATPDRMDAVIAYLDGVTWEPLTDSAASGDTVTATTDHFTYFAVVWTAAGAMQTAGACDGTFVACGGDIVGTWSVTVGCLTLPAETLAGAAPAGCDGATGEANLDLTGTATFEANGDYSIDFVFAQEITITFPKTCLPMGASCADLAKQGDPAPTDTGDACEQTMSDSQPNMGMGTYTVDEAAMTRG